MAKKTASKFDTNKVSLSKIEIINQVLHFSKASESEVLTMKLGKNFDFNFEAKMCRVRLYFEFFIENKTPLEQAATFHIDFHFHISNMEDCIIKNEDSMKIDSVLSTQVLAIAYSTARGIIYERLLNTPFKETILPIINPYEVLNELD
jgi:hypothetical protein